jgi:hypothetical protein
MFIDRKRAAATLFMAAAAVFILVAHTIGSMGNDLFKRRKERVMATDKRTIGLRILLTFSFAFLLLIEPPASGLSQSSGLTVVAGNGTAGFSGDGGLATMARINRPEGIAVDSVGNLYIADTGNDRIRKVTPYGAISTVAGNGTRGFGGDGGPATSAQLYGPVDVAVDSAGNLYIADFNNSRIRMVTPAGVISTVAGGGTEDPGDGGPATSAAIIWPTSVAVDEAGNLYFSEARWWIDLGDRVRKVSPDGVISTVAGGGIEDPAGGGPATSVALDYIAGMTIDSEGNLYIANSARVHKVTPDGIIGTVAGNGSAGYSGDGGPAALAQVDPAGIAVGPEGNLYITQPANNCIRKVAADGTISTVVADLNEPYDIELGPEAYLYICSISGNQVLIARDSSATYTTMYFPEVIAGGGWSTQFTITNTGLTEASGTLVFRSPQSNPLVVNAKVTNSMETINTASTFPFTVPPGGTTFLSTIPSDNPSEMQTGWAQLEAAGSLVSGMATYEFASNANTYSMFSVPQAQLLQFATIPVHNDDTLGKETAYAIANPGSTPASIKLVLVDQSGTIVDDSVVIEIGPGQQIARYLWEDLDCPRFRGSLILFAQEGQPFVLLPIVEKQGLFTALPMAASQ